MQRAIIFVAGIHGVGKTSFCQRVAEALAFDHISASTLIRRAQQRSSEQHKAVAAVAKNQDALISELHKHHWEAQALLLDGLFCLLTTANAIQPVPMATFQEMCPGAVILLQEQAVTIQQRLQARDSVAYPLDLLEALQAAETHQATLVCDALGIPLLTITGGDVTEALDFIRRTTTHQKD
jgi:adenylate kinase